MTWRLVSIHLKYRALTIADHAFSLSWLAAVRKPISRTMSEHEEILEVSKHDLSLRYKVDMIGSEAFIPGLSLPQSLTK
jgi:hypothetical protein